MTRSSLIRRLAARVLRGSLTIAEADARLGVSR